jgi:cytochrome o ubiquinol oxidase subunit 2
MFMMKKLIKSVFLFLVLATLVTVGVTLVKNGHFALLNPQGMIALKERNLIIIPVLLMLCIVIPVYIMTFLIAWRYRAENHKAKYTPDKSANKLLELSWWIIPSIVVLIMAFITWRGAHDLDPVKPLNSDKKPITIQVVALQWKWLFIYPEQNIATVNYIQFPEKTPINFELTADAPMNSFWIPQLGGQMYAMAGMGTKLHLIADKPGEFSGSSAEISGGGFAGMKFVAKSTSQEDFESWVQSVKTSTNVLDSVTYNKLALPSEENPVAFYASADENLYNKIIMKFASPQQSEHTMSQMTH